MGELRIHRRAAGDTEVGVLPENLADLGVDGPVVERVLEAFAQRQPAAFLLRMGPLARNTRRVGEHPAREAFARALGRRVIHLLEHARHAHQQRRTEIVEILHDGREVARQAQLDGASEGQDLHVAREHVAHRQEHEQAAVRDVAGARHVLQAREAEKREIGMRQLHALGVTGRTRGVHDSRQRVAVGLALAGFELLVGDGAAELGEGRQRAVVDDEDLVQARDSGADLIDLAAHLAGLGEGDLHARIVEDVLDLSRRIGLVHRHDNRADGQKGHVESDPFPTRVREDGHPLADFDAVRHKTFGELADDPLELRGGELPPSALLLVLDEGGVGQAFDAVSQEIIQVDVRVDGVVERRGVLFDDNLTHGFHSSNFLRRKSADSA